MNKSELVKAIAHRAGCSQTLANAVLSEALSEIVTQVSAGNRVTLVGFGHWERRYRQERSGRNPQTGKPLIISAADYPAFTAGKLFKEAVSNGSSNDSD